jgi:uncharacterized membrane protein YqjE
VEPPIDNGPELVDEPDPGPIRGLFRSLANLLATAIGIAQTRLELLSTELQEEVHRAAEILVWTIVALLAALIGLFMLALRSSSSSGTRICRGFDRGHQWPDIAQWLHWPRAKIRSRPRLLDATLTELERPREPHAATLLIQ